ncbi:MAG: PTS sugar transporter subunit IIA [Clostridiales bacterium]|nr:PTS sugar transporter subunit IIA [Clostridiales bacterium]
MIGILIATHGGLALEMMKSSEMIIGKNEKFFAMPLNPEDTIQSFSEQFCRSVKELGNEDGVLVLTDIYGGSPFNVAAKAMREMDFECLSGVNLPMLLEALTAREGKTLRELKDIVKNIGSTSIKDLREVLKW